MERSQVIAKLSKFLEKETGHPIRDPAAQLDIDSFAMMLLITFIKVELGTELDVNKMDFDNFVSLNSMADLVLATHAASSV